MVEEKRYSGKYDLLSMAVSLVCLVHCVALPLMVSILPIAGVHAEAEWLEWTTVLLTAVFGGWAILKGFVAHHRQKTIVAGFAVGLLLILIANLPVQPVFEMVLKGAGAVSLVWAHLRNRAESRRCCTPLV